MRQPQFRPGLLTLPFTSRAASVLIQLIDPERLERFLTRGKADLELRDEVYAAYDMMHTASKLPEALGVARLTVEQPDLKTEPMTTLEAADVLGVKDSRVRQMVGEGALIPVNHDGRRHLFDPADVYRLQQQRSNAA